MENTISLRIETQQNEISDRVSALYAVVRPILFGLLSSIKKEILEQCGGLDGLTLKMLPRAYRPGDGDVGICFEYAVHNAIMNTPNWRVLERIDDALKLCKIKGKDDPSSILFGLEKAGSTQIIDDANNILTNESLLYSGSKGPPVKLRKHIDNLAKAFSNKKFRQAIPSSISGLWRADLFAGYSDSDKWVGTTIKLNKSDLKADKGLRIGIVPAQPTSDDLVYIDSKVELIVCPLPYDKDFVEIFYQGWNLVKAFIDADAKLPKAVALPTIEDREVAKNLDVRRDHPVMDVIIALGTFAQPYLLDTTQDDVSFLHSDFREPAIRNVVVPKPMAT